ncbi:MAG: sugar phosphate isomerase/epimerase [Kiritimatiellaeota bacterium]|nr:sugar phosphate isomerase/epimerase [Kiritimatiellota bacterium]
MEKNYLTGFADEAATGIDGQIKATLELGWKYIEARAVDGKNIHDVSDEAFDVIYGKLKDSGVDINCFGSGIANWSRHLKTVPFEEDLEATKRAVARMKRLGTKLIRIMSYPVIKNEDESDAADQMFEERVRRLNILVPMFTDEGILPVHENCSNYGGMSWKHTLQLLERVPGMKLVYDTGNPIWDDDRLAATPGQKQSSWEFYSHVKEHVAYVHIKDGSIKDGKPVFWWPGEGTGDVVKICKDLLSNGYQGGFSMEAHMGAVYHDPSVVTDDESRYATYVEYGRRFEKLLASLLKG